MVYNSLGISQLLAGVVVGTLASYLIGVRGGIVLAGLLVAAMDLSYRKHNQGPMEGIPLFQPTRGGNIMFMPIWIVATATIVLAAIR